MSGCRPHNREISVPRGMGSFPRAILASFFTFRSESINHDEPLASFRPYGTANVALEEIVGSCQGPARSAILFAQ